jgi:hypothetical protein
VNTSSRDHGRIRSGGWSLIAATVLFAAVFTWLSVKFGYPDVLERPAAEVLPALLALGNTGRVVWFTFGLIPLLLPPTALGVREAAGPRAPGLGRLAFMLAVLSAASMMTGLMRWPFLHWSLAQQWTLASDSSRAILKDGFDTANLYLGNVIGEFAGELFLNGFFLVSAVAIAGGRKRWLVLAGAAASGLGWISMLRNMTQTVESVAAINNVVLPIWMLVLGVMLLRSARS